MAFPPAPCLAAITLSLRRVIAIAYRAVANGLAVGSSARIIGTMASIAFQHITKRYTDGVEAVTDMNLTIADGDS